MKKWLPVSFIAVYLTALSWGIVAHAVSFMQNSHPAMYFLVWDMFCGWSAYSSRLHIVGEGVDGNYYELAPGPWGSFEPFGELDRRHYDSYAVNAARTAINTLEHTRHPDMARIFVVEEAWAKKYNLPERVWKARYEKPKDVKRYYLLRQIVASDGTVLEKFPSWTERQVQASILANPRLLADRKRGMSFYLPPVKQWTPRFEEAGGLESPPRVSAPLGN